MTHKNRMTVADILLSLREQLLTAQAEKNKDMLVELRSSFHHLWNVAARRNDPKALGLLDDFTYTVNHFLGDVDFKALDALPSVDAIQDLEVSSAGYKSVKATLVHRVIVRDELHPLNLGSTLAEEIIDPDWIGIAFIQGPYQDTFDLLFYKFDGRLISWRQFDSAELAVNNIEKHCGIKASEWESCEIELTDEDGKFFWGSGNK